MLTVLHAGLHAIVPVSFAQLLFAVFVVLAVFSGVLGLLLRG